MSQTVREVVVAAYGRTGIAKARKGGLHLTHPVDFTGQLLAGVVRKVPQLAVSEIDDVVLGCARPQEIQCSNIGRLSALRAGFPASVPGQTVSRLCSSGLQAIGSAANSIAVGEADVIVAGGVEFLTSIGMGTPEQYQCKELKEIDDGPYLSMGITAENVARRYGVSRAEMEALAVESHRRAHAAQEAGVFDAEIVPVNAVQEDGSTALFRRDEGIRPGTTAEKLAELKPCFLEDGLVTAATSSQVSDGRGRRGPDEPGEGGTARRAPHRPVPGLRGGGGGPLLYGDRPHLRRTQDHGPYRTHGGGYGCDRAQ